MYDVLKAIHDRIGVAPRRIPAQQHGYFFARPPYWLPRKDPLMDFYRAQKILLVHGMVTFGTIVHADFHAFEPGPCDVAATVVFVSNLAARVEPARLVKIGRAYYAKHRAELQNVNRNYVMLEPGRLERVMNQALPADLAEDLPLRATRLIVRRNHLPGGLLTDSLVPLLVSPRAKSAMIVPARVWPAPFAASWRAETVGYAPNKPITDFVRVTPQFLKQVREEAEHRGLGRHNWYLSLRTEEPCTGYGLRRCTMKIRLSKDPAQHLMSESLGIRILIERDQVDLLAGLVLGWNHDYDLDWARA